MVNRIAGQMLFLMLPLLSPEGDGGGGGGEGEKPGAGGDSAKPGSEQKPENTDGAAGAKPGAGGKQVPAEDPRTAGILKDLQGERTKRQTLETQIKQVGAPLSGLIRSERLQIGARITGAVLAIVCLSRIAG